MIELRYHAAKRKLKDNSQPGIINNILKPDVGVLLVITPNSDNMAEKRIANFQFLIFFRLYFMRFIIQIKLHFNTVCVGKIAFFRNTLVGKVMVV